MINNEYHFYKLGKEWVKAKLILNISLIFYRLIKNIIIKYIFTLFALVALCFFNTTNSNYSELALLDEWKTIKELRENINDLDRVENELSNDLDTLNTDHELKSFFKKDLTLNELNIIRSLVNEYNIKKAKLESILLAKAKELLPVIEEKKLILEEKKSFYSKLTPYIDWIYNNEYLEYIEWDAKIFNEQRDVETDIIAKKELLNNKVEIIESKIQEHRNYINESIKKVIETRLDEKIQKLKDNVTFQMLNYNSKIKVLDKTIVKIKIKLQNLEKSMSNSQVYPYANNFDQKVQTYNIAVNKLEAFKNSIK